MTTQNDFEILIDKYQNCIYLYCFRMIGDTQVAEDITQEVFLKVFIKLKKKNLVCTSSLLYKIAHDLCIDHIRKQNVAKSVLKIFFTQAKLTYNDTYFENKIDEDLQGILMKLSSVQRSVIILRGIDEMEFAVISCIVGKRESTTRKIYQRARVKLKKMLEMEDMNEKYQFSR